MKENGTRPFSLADRAIPSVHSGVTYPELYKTSHGAARAYSRIRRTSRDGRRAGTATPAASIIRREGRTD